MAFIEETVISKHKMYAPRKDELVPVHEYENEMPFIYKSNFIVDSDIPQKRVMFVTMDFSVVFKQPFRSLVRKLLERFVQEGFLTEISFLVEKTSEKPYSSNCLDVNYINPTPHIVDQLFDPSVDLHRDMYVNVFQIKW